VLLLCGHGLGEQALEGLHLLAQTIRLIFLPPASSASIFDETLKVFKHFVQLLCSLLLRGLERLSILGQLLNRSKSTLKLLVYGSLVLLEFFGCRWRYKGIYVSLFATSC